MISLKSSLIAAAALVSAIQYGSLDAAEAVNEESLYISDARMQEWNDMRFGLFIHWGPWSQTEIGYIWKMTTEESREEGEKRFDLWKTFNPTAFDPAKWAKAAKDAGMKYVVFVTKHHDGVNNYDTQLSDFKTTNPIVPYSKNKNADLTKAVVDAFRAEGLAIGLYYSHIDWHHPDARYFSRNHWDYDDTLIDTQPDVWRRYVEFEQGQLRELLTNYGKIDIIWFDITWPHAHTGNQEIEHPVERKDMLDTLAMMKELQPDIIFNDRGTDKFGGFYTPEQQVPTTGLPGNWESNITITNSRGFWYKGDNVTAKPTPDLIRMLVEIASKGGNFLMNVGPRPDGELSKTEYDALAGIGAWMKVNSESIYGTRRSLFADLPWGWSTTKGNTVYLHVFDWPENGQLRVPGLLTDVSKAYLLSDPKRKALGVKTDGDSKLIRVGRSAPDSVDTVVVLEFNKSIQVNNIYRQRPGQPIELGTAIASIDSATARYNYGTATRKGNFIQDIKSPQDRVEWTFQANEPGAYEIRIQYATQNEQAGSELAIAFDDSATFRHKVEGTADWTGDILEVMRQTMDEGERHNNLWLFQTKVVGSIKIDGPGDHRLTIEPISISKDYLAFIKSVSLVRIDSDQ